MSHYPLWVKVLEESPFDLVRTALQVRVPYHNININIVGLFLSSAIACLKMTVIWHTYWTQQEIYRRSYWHTQAVTPPIPTLRLYGFPRLLPSESADPASLNINPILTLMSGNARSPRILALPGFQRHSFRSPRQRCTRITRRDIVIVF